MNKEQIVRTIKATGKVVWDAIVVGTAALITAVTVSEYCGIGKQK